MENNGNSIGDHSNGVVVVRPKAEIMSRQHLPYYVGISEVTAGAKNISMNLIIIPPAGAAEPHRHKGYETAIYLLKGRVDTRYGKKLEMMSSGKIDWPKLIADGERLGITVIQEEQNFRVQNLRG